MEFQSQCLYDVAGLGFGVTDARVVAVAVAGDEDGGGNEPFGVGADACGGRAACLRLAISK